MSVTQHFHDKLQDEALDSGLRLHVCRLLTPLGCLWVAESLALLFKIKVEGKQAVRHNLNMEESKGLLSLAELMSPLSCVLLLWVCVCHCTRAGWRTVLRVGVSPILVWVPVFELTYPGCGTSAFPGWALTCVWVCIYLMIHLNIYNVRFPFFFWSKYNIFKLWDIFPYQFY